MRLHYDVHLGHGASEYYQLSTLQHSVRHSQRHYDVHLGQDAQDTGCRDQGTLGLMHKDSTVQGIAALEHRTREVLWKRPKQPPKVCQSVQSKIPSSPPFHPPPSLTQVQQTSINKPVLSFVPQSVSWPLLECVYPGQA
jgi:hypothetical protein